MTGRCEGERLRSDEVMVETKGGGECEEEVVITMFYCYCYSCCGEEGGEGGYASDAIGVLLVM